MNAIRFDRTVRQVAGCVTIGIIAAYGIFYAAQGQPSQPVTPTPTPVSSSMDAGTASGRFITTEEADVLAEGDDWDHPWESCLTDEVTITCPDGYVGDLPKPEPFTPEYIYGGQKEAFENPLCTSADVQPELPCQVDMLPTYVVDPVGGVHNDCIIVLTTAEDSIMVCDDDTVWPS